MDEHKKQQALEALARSVAEKGREIDGLHKDLQTLRERIRELQHKAQAGGSERLSLALREAYTRASRAEQSLVEAHLALSLQPNDFAIMPHSPTTRAT